MGLLKILGVIVGVAFVGPPALLLVIGVGYVILAGLAMLWLSVVGIIYQPAFDLANAISLAGPDFPIRAIAAAFHHG